jgi:fluoride exporter
MNLLNNILLVGLGSSIGGILRYIVYLLLANHKYFFVKTITVNILGSLLIGLIYGLSSNNHSSPLMSFLSIGICGGFTTFSTFSYDNIQLLKSGEYLLFFLYCTASFVLCIGACFIGLYTSKYLTK